MGKGTKRLIIDTSAVNALADDADVDSIGQSLGISYYGVVTETVLAEVIAHRDGVSAGDCLAFSTD